MKVLVACEFSGVVRDAFIARGHDAWSCDVLPTEQPGPHIQSDVLDVLGDGWDLMIAHPPCTHLSVSGARWFAQKRAQISLPLEGVPKFLQEEALAFVRKLLDAPIPRIALENPVSIISSRVRRPDQIIQPWQFGHPATKATCLWLQNLPPLQPTSVVVPGRNVVRDGPRPGPNRWRERSRTFEGIADAMAAQWSAFADDHRIRQHDPRDLKSEPCCVECCNCSVTCGGPRRSRLRFGRHDLEVSGARCIRRSSGWTSW